ncbi:MAG: glycosyltransferase family 2 protein [Myxococcales bacterium]|nr:glycosyltransferase family 2 protein [Myxococcales bacterium]
MSPVEAPGLEHAIDVGPAAAARSVSVVVPVLNAEASLDELVARITSVLGAQDAPFEILLVNDGSRDASWARIEALAARDERVHGIDLMRNFGQHAALLAGIRAARCDRIVTLDDDLQHPPEAIPALLAELEAGADLAYGTPQARPHSLLRRASSAAVHTLLASLLGSQISRHSSPFRAFRSQVRDCFAHYEGSFVTIDALLGWGAGAVAHVSVEHAPRKHGRSNYTPYKLLRHAFHTVTNFSVRPLQFASVLGFVFTVIGFSATCYALGFYKLRGLAVPPDTFIFAVVCFFSGVQLFTLGIIGEYLARVHLRTMRRPSYVVRRETGAPTTR